jgi:hypothetical protein
VHAENCVATHLKNKRSFCATMYLKFLDRFSQNTQISNFMETDPVGAELFRADGQGEANGRLPQLNKAD